MSDIKISDLTDGTLVDNEWIGTGVFDKLIAAVNDNIDAQYQKNRIKDTDYANVYLGSMQGVLTASIEFLLREQLAEEQVNTEKLNQEAIIAKVRDEHGRVIDEDGNNTPADDTDTQHAKALVKADKDIQVATAQIAGIEADNDNKAAQFSKDYGTTEVPSGFPATVDAINGKVPKSKWEADMYKAAQEIAIGDKTVEGFGADGYYKIAKTMQELMFALANAGVIDDNDKNSTEDNIYSRLIKTMEMSLNRQAIKWGDTAFVDLDGKNSNQGSTGDTSVGIDGDNDELPTP